jgi:hypothetical protein
MQSQTLRPPARRARWPWLAVAAILIAAAVAAYWRWPKPPAGDPVAAPLTGLPGWALHPSFSPDGKKVAFSWNGDHQDNMDVYVKQIGSAGQLRLTTDQSEDTDPVWSPDDRNIAFTRAQPGGTRAVMLISPYGGPERKIAEVISNPDVESRLCWTPDGKWLAVAAQDSAQEVSAIRLYSPDTGERRRLTHGGAGEYDYHPSISPDGKLSPVDLSRREMAGVQPGTPRRVSRAPPSTAADDGLESGRRGPQPLLGGVLFFPGHCLGPGLAVHHLQCRNRSPPVAHPDFRRRAAVASELRRCGSSESRDFGGTAPPCL